MTAAPVAVEAVPGFPAMPGGVLIGPPIIYWPVGSPEHEAASILVGQAGDVLKEIGCHLKVPICGIPGRPASDPATSSTATVLVMTGYVLDRWLDGPWMNSQNDQGPSDSTEGVAKSESRIDRGAFKKEREAYWKKEAESNPGKYSNDDLDRMRKGRAPIGPDGKPIELHHRDGTPDGPLDPMSQKDHRGGDNYKKNHPWLGN